MGPQADAQALVRACTALWTATLSLMAAFMHTAGPAHRYLIARRIARNLSTLHAQDCFGADTRERFAALSERWQDKAQRLAPHEDQRPRGGLGLLQSRLFAR
jgi:hypothetical protein